MDQPLEREKDRGNRRRRMVVWGRTIHCLICDQNVSEWAAKFPEWDVGDPTQIRRKRRITPVGEKMRTIFGLV